MIRRDRPKQRLIDCYNRTILCSIVVLGMYLCCLLFVVLCSIAAGCAVIYYYCFCCLSSSTKPPPPPLHITTSFFLRAGDVASAKTIFFAWGLCCHLRALSIDKRSTTAPRPFIFNTLFFVVDNDEEERGDHSLILFEYKHYCTSRDNNTS